MAELFRRKGLKVTPQRELIFGLVHGNDRHPSAEAVFAEATARMPTMSLKTVYQTLNDLVEMGEIRLLDVGTGSGRFDPNLRAHHHLVCHGCSKVSDVHVDVGPLRLTDSQRQGFEVTATEVVFRGTCPDCQQRQPAPPPVVNPTTSTDRSVPCPS